MNNSKNTGHCMTECVSEKNTQGAVREPAESGTTGMDQSTRDYREPARGPSNQGNTLPPIPPTKQGN